MQVLVTGNCGFIGKNLMEALGRIDEIKIDTLSRDNTAEDLVRKVSSADFIFHLAGVNRPENDIEFKVGNKDLTQKIVEAAVASDHKPPILMTSSTQVLNNNPYGVSKKEGEEILEQYALEHKSAVYIYRLPNVFGKWSKPNYNTVIATWCHNISRGLPIQINDRAIKLNLVYIDDVISYFLRHIDDNNRSGVNHLDIAPVYSKSLGEIFDLLDGFKNSRDNLATPVAGKGFGRALYATYLSFLEIDNFSYKLKGHQDERGSFYEFLKTSYSGQVSISTTLPGVTRGNHYHNTKNEKFLVIQGKASIKLRQIHGDETIEYLVNGEKMEVVEMIPGYTHDITNIGNDVMVLLLWANEVFDPDVPDTYFLKV